MVLKFSTVPSGCSSSAFSTDTEYQSRLPPSNSLVVSPVVPSDADFSVRNRCWFQPPPYVYGDFGIETEADFESEDDDFSEGSSMSSDGTSSFDTHSVCSIPNELDILNKRRREMLCLSISKIQTMNASNVFVSLRKSLLIFNTMKSLQRDLDECDGDVYSSLMEGGEEALFDDGLLEEGNSDAGVWDFEREMPSFCDQFLENRPACGDNELPTHFQANSQDLGSFINAVNPIERDANCNSNSCWQNGSNYIDDYLGVLDVWENADYNPLNNCNLSESEILHMFGPCLDRASTQLLTLA